MQMVPAVIGNRNEARIDCPVPPLVGHRAWTRVSICGIVRSFDDAPRVRRSDDEARRAQPWLRLLAAPRYEITHDAEEAALSAEFRMNEILDVVDRTVVKRN